MTNYILMKYGLPERRESKEYYKWNKVSGMWNGNRKRHEILSEMW